MPFLGNVWTISFDSCTWSAWRLASLPKPDWSKYVLHCGVVRKGGTPPHTSPLWTILATIKSCHCLILWFRKTSAVAAAYIAATDDARADGGQTDGWRADGGIETDAPSHPSRFSWGGRFSALKLRMRFFSPQIAVVFSRGHMYFSPEWMSFFSWCKLTKFSQLSD